MAQSFTFFFFFQVDEIFMNSKNIELLASGGDFLAQNQKVPSAWEACVSSLAVSQYLALLSDQDMAAAQALSESDGRRR